MKKFLASLFVLLFSILASSSQTFAQAELLRIKYVSEARFDSALYYAEEDAAIIRGTRGEKSIQFADALNSLAVSHFYQGNYKKAKYYSLRELEIREALRSVKDVKYLQAIDNIVIIDNTSGNPDEALIYVKKAEKIAAKNFGTQSIEYANILSSYGNVYTVMGSSVNDMVFLKKALDYYTRAENIYKRNDLKAGKKLIVNKSNIATYYNNMGNVPMAETLFQEVAGLCEKEFGSSDPMYASALNNLGVFYYNNGFYKQAENYFIQAVDIYKSGLLAERKKTGICINNLGALYYEVGNFNAAEKLIIESRELFGKNHQTQNPDYALVANNQATVILTKEYYANSGEKVRSKLLTSGKLLRLADSLFTMNCRMPHPEGLAIRNNLSLWYKMIGESTKSLQIMYDATMQSGASLKPISMVNKMRVTSLMPLFQSQDAHSALDAVLIPIKAKMTDHMYDDKVLKQNAQSTTASTRFILKLVLGDQSKIKDALGPYHPSYAIALKSFIPLYKSIGSFDMEEELMLNYMNVINHNILQDFSFLSESEKEMYFQTRQTDMHSFLSYIYRRKDVNPGITSYGYDLVIQNKGLMLRSSTAMRQAILNSNNPVLLKNYDDWQTLQKEISATYSTPVEMRTSDIRDLEARANALEKSLVIESQAFGEYRKGMQLNWKDVKNSLESDEAAIEFTHFKVRERDLGDVVYYCALIVRRNSSYPEMVKLFEEKQLEEIIGSNNGNDFSYIDGLYGNSKKANDELYKLIWQPLESYLEGVKKVLVSPTGMLYKISFASISSGRNIYLCDNYQIQVKGSTGNIVSQNQLPSGNELSALVFGGIKYSGDTKESQVWDYLSGTKDEGDAVSKILEKVNVDVKYLSDISATETFLKENARNYNILHVATHGFFFPDPNEVRFTENVEEVEVGEVTFRGAMRGFGVNSFVNNMNPLMRSGLVLAGANEVWNKSEPGKEDDGVLTAQEVTQIDMRKNFLVVLSACETGLGDIKGSEGVYGLQRSFKMAGVKYVMVSLWQVPDKETVEFMEVFYTNLLKVNNIREAFSETQAIMRKKYDPYYWAAFNLIE